MRPTAAIACSVMIVGFWLMTWHAEPPDAIVLHDVKVLERIDDYSFRGLVKDDTNEWLPFAYSGCHDYKLTREIDRGITLTELKYFENFNDSCNEIAPAEYGYMLLRDPQLRPIKENFDEIASKARQTAAQTGRTGWPTRAYASSPAAR